MGGQKGKEGFGGARDQLRRGEERKERRGRRRYDDDEVGGRYRETFGMDRWEGAEAVKREREHVIWEGREVEG